MCCAEHEGEPREQGRGPRPARPAWLPAHPSRRELPGRRLEVSGDTWWGCLCTESLTGTIERLPGIVPGDTDHAHARQQSWYGGEKPWSRVLTLHLVCWRPQEVPNLGPQSLMWGN